MQILKTGDVDQRALRFLESFKSPESRTTASESSDMLDTTPLTIKSWWLSEAPIISKTGYTTLALLRNPTRR